MAIADACELRLLRCTLNVAPDQTPQSGSIDSPLQASLLRAVELIEQGLYAEVLAMEVMKDVFGERYHEFREDSDPFLIGKNLLVAISKKVGKFVDVNEGDSAAVTLVLAAAVAFLLVFQQTNFTGPLVSFPVLPKNIIWSLGDWSDEAGRAWDSWARSELMVDGCDVEGKCSYPQYLLLAKLLFVAINFRNEPCTRGWWAARALFSHQKILVERSPTLLKEVAGFYSEVVKSFGTKLAREFCGWYRKLNNNEEDVIASAVFLEAALVEYYYGHSEEASVYLEQAGKLTGLNYTVEGALGYRRQEQVEPNIVMVLRDESGLEALQKGAGTPGDGSDVLLEPKLEEPEVKFLHQKVLSPTQQAIILVHSLDVKKKNPQNELSSWDVAPYIEAVGAQHESPFMVKRWCELLRLKWENTRGPTRQRAFLLMENIVDEIRGGSLGVSQRMNYVFCVQFPCFQALLKQYANMLVGFGCVGEALKIFEELELWHSLIDCHRMLGDTARAVSLIKENLEISPLDPRLWCSLGHATNDHTCFIKSWEVSGGRFVAAQRALARFAFNRKEYSEAVKQWDLALALNPLYSDGWFAAGFAALKDNQMEKALDSYIRTVLLDPENGEAFNNIAALHMRKEDYKQANAAFQQALKLKRNSWELWDNYGRVLFELGNYSQAARALSQVFELNRKNVNVILLEQLVEQAEKNQRDSGENQESKKLVESLGDLISKMASSGSYGGEVWGLKARWHKLMGDSGACSDALLRQVRAFQGSDWQHDSSKFQRFAGASLELCQHFVEAAGKRDLATAQRHLLSTLKQGQEFIDTEEYKALQTILSEVETKQQQQQEQ